MDLKGVHIGCLLTSITKQKHDLLVFLTSIVKITFTGQSKLVIFFQNACCILQCNSCQCKPTSISVQCLCDSTLMFPAISPQNTTTFQSGLSQCILCHTTPKLLLVVTTTIIAVLKSETFYEREAQHATSHTKIKLIEIYIKYKCIFTHGQVSGLVEHISKLRVIWRWPIPLE